MNHDKSTEAATSSELVRDDHLLILPRAENGLFVSDLHLFSPRCAVQHVDHMLAEYAEDHSCVVLGGDIFDFRWSNLGGHRRTLQEAKTWLESLLLKTGKSTIVYLPGNHDCHPDFLAILSEIAGNDERFLWRPHHVQIGENLFLHGDLLEVNSLDALQKYRGKFHHTKPQPAIAHRGYDVAVGLRVHKFIPKLRHIPLRTCNRLGELLQSVPVEEPTSIQTVFFGHTHAPVDGLHLRGKQYFNPGSGLRHMKLRPREFAIAPSDTVTPSDTV